MSIAQQKSHQKQAQHSEISVGSRDKEKKEKSLPTHLLNMHL